MVFLLVALNIYTIYVSFKNYFGRYSFELAKLVQLC